MRSILLGLLLAALSAPAHAAQEPPPGDDPAYYFLLGRHLEGQGKIDDAIAAHRKAIALDGQSAELRAELAGLYARQDRAVESLEMAESALERDPDNVEANRILGSIYAAYTGQRQPIRSGENVAEYPAKAIAALEKARGVGYDVAVELSLGRLYVQTGAYDKAVPVLQRVVAFQPEFAEGAMLLAAAQEGAGRIDDAIGTLERVVAGNPTFYRGQLRLAELYERRQRWPEAADAYGRAHALNPKATALAARRAAALINGREPAKARDLLQQALSTAKGPLAERMLLYLLAEAHRALGEIAEARSVAERLLDANPDDERGLHVMSLILQEQGEHKEAERVLRRIIERDPLDANALNSLGYMFAERGERLGEAVELLQRALKIEPDNPAFLDSLGWAYFQQDRLDLADAPLTKAAGSLTNSSVVQDHLGDLRFKQQRYAEAIEAWERALAGDGQSIDRAKIEQKLRDARARVQ